MNNDNNKKGPCEINRMCNEFETVCFKLQPSQSVGCCGPFGNRLEPCNPCFCGFHHISEGGGPLHLPLLGPSVEQVERREHPSCRSLERVLRCRIIRATLCHGFRLVGLHATDTYASVRMTAEAHRSIRSHARAGLSCLRRCLAFRSLVFRHFGFLMPLRGKVPSPSRRSAARV